MCRATQHSRADLQYMHISRWWNPVLQIRAIWCLLWYCTVTLWISRSDGNKDSVVWTSGIKGGHERKYAIHWQLHWKKCTLIHFWTLFFSDIHWGNCYRFFDRKHEIAAIKMFVSCRPEVCVQSVLSSIPIAFTLCNEICNINHYYLSCDLDVDIEIEEQMYHRLKSHYARSLAEHGKVYWTQVHFYLWDILHNLICFCTGLCK